MQRQESFALLALHAVSGLGPRRIQQLTQVAGSAHSVLQNPQAASRALQAACPPLPDAQALHALGRGQKKAAKNCGAHSIAWNQDEYPPLLCDLKEPPPVLHVLGNYRLLANPKPGIAVVGARACTPYGRQQAKRFGQGLAFAEEVLVSGAARGIDQIAMQAAVDAGGKVIAVLGSALDKPYPKESLGLLHSILQQEGAIISEFPFGTGPKAGHFPRRNRLLAALSRAVLVIQATTKSGTMNTVDWALSLGREVFALPGPVDDIACSGTNQMLQEGASMALGPEDMLATLNRLLGPSDQKEDALLESLEGQDATPAELANILSKPEEQIRLELTEWELRGRVIRLPSGHYHRCGPQS